MDEDCCISADDRKATTSDACQKYTFVEVEKQHLKQLRTLVLSMFPVSYDIAFYRSILLWPVKKIAFERETAIGALCARVDTVDDTNKLYIAILGVMVFWRRRGIGKMLLDFVEDYCRNDTSVSSIYLHVQKDNTDAQKFYSKFGFVVSREIEHFYRRTACPTALLMEKSLSTE